MNDFHRLVARLRKSAKNLDKVGSEAAKTVANTIVRELVYRTPVDESTALSNWVVTIGRSTSGQIPAHIVGKQGSTRFQSAEITIQNAAAALLGKKSGQNIYISNKLDYISELNDGSSLQAPAGFVEAAILVGRNAAKSVKVKKL